MQAPLGPQPVAGQSAVTCMVDKEDSSKHCSTTTSRLLLLGIIETLAAVDMDEGILLVGRFVRSC